MASTEKKLRRWLPPRKWHEKNLEFGSLNFVYQCAADGRLPSIKVGGRVLIASDALDQLYEAQSSVTAID